MSLPDDVTKACAEVLNDLLKVDPKAAKALFDFSTPCNEELVEHPHVIVREIPTEDGTTYELSALGIINAILNKLGQQRLAAVLEGEDDLLMFKLYRGPTK